MAQSTYIDFDLFGQTDETGDIKVLTNVEALYNAFVQWVYSFKGEYIRNRSLGGIFVSLLEKPVSEENAQIFQSRFLDAIRNQFQPAITVVDSEVEADVDGERYIITLKGYLPDMKQTFIYKDSFRKIV